MKSTKRWFELAEYTSLGFSALGTIAAAATQQTLYAATPLTITLSLNLLNRQELARRTRQIGNNVTQLEQQVPSNIRSLSNQIQSVENSLNALPHSLEATSISKLEEIRQKSQQEIVRLREQVNILETNFNNLPASSEPIELDSIEMAIASLSQQLNSLTEQFNNRLEPKEIEEIKDKLTGMVTYDEFTKIDTQINKINTQLQALPSTFNFTSLEEKITEIGASLKNFATSESLISLADRLDLFVEQFKNRPELEEIEKIRKRLSDLEPVTEQLEEFKAQLDRFATAETVTDMQAQLIEQLNALKLHLDNLPVPSEPIDLTEIEQAIAAIIARLASLESIPEQIAQFQSELSLLSEQVNLENQSNHLDLSSTQIEELNREIEKLQQKFQIVNHLASEIEELKRPVQLSNQIGEIHQHLEDLDVSMAALHDNTNHIEKELENQKIQLDDRTQQLLIVPQKLEKLESVTTQLQERTKLLERGSNKFVNELNWLNKLINHFVKIEDLEQELTKISKQLKGQIHFNIEKKLANQFVKVEYLEKELTKISEQFGQIDVNLEKQIQTFNQLIKETRPAYSYELVFDRDGSRKILIEALKTAQVRLILVCPWLTSTAIKDQIWNEIISSLRRGVNIDIGWGYLSDVDRSTPFSRNNLLNAVASKGQEWKYEKLPCLENLQGQSYPGHLKMKLLGTHEKFLVCDNSFAMLGSHNFLTSGDSSIERELGLKTTDPHIVKELIERFERAQDLGHSFKNTYQYLNETPF